jgi:hypothetical protein
LNALFFVALLLYLIPAAFGLGNSPEHRRRFQLAAIVTLGTAIAIAVVASVISRVDTRDDGLVLENLNHDQLTWQCPSLEIVDTSDKLLWEQEGI